MDVVSWPTATPAAPAMLKMFSQTYTPHNPPEDCALEDCASEKMSHCRFLSLVTLTFDPRFELGWDFCTVQLTFHRPTFNPLIVLVIEVSCWQANRQTDIHLAPLCYAVG